MRQPLNRPALMLPSERMSQRSLAYGPGSMRRVGEWWHTTGLGNEAHSEDSHSQRLAGLAGEDFTYMGKKMTAEELTAYQQKYIARWRRWLAELSWKNGPMATWKPEMTEQQKKEFDEYRIKHSTPF
jgi:hypothetical protein